MNTFQIFFHELKFEKKIGSGYVTLYTVVIIRQYADVFRGYWKGRRVAIKKIFNLEEMSIADSMREASVMALLPRHENLVLFYGMTIPPDPTCYVTEYYEGGSLFAYIHNKGLTINNKTRVKSEYR